MDILPIIKYPSPILSQKTEKVSLITEEIASLIPRMKESMKEHEGVGLAAPQINDLRQIIVIKEKDAAQAFLNPRILKKSREVTTEEEGCLSLPGLFLSVKRYEKITLSCLNEKGKSITIEAKGLAARIFQHEVDHLNGKLIINRIAPWKKYKIRAELKKFKDAYEKKNS